MGQLTQTTNEVQQILDTVVTNPMTAQGDLIIGGANGTPTRLPKGSTAGQVLVSNGSTLEWGTPGGGGGGGGTLVEVMCSEWPIDGMSSPTWQFADSGMSVANLITMINNGETVIITFTADHYGYTYCFYLPVVSVGTESSSYMVEAQGFWCDGLYSGYWLSFSMSASSGYPDSFYLSARSISAYSA